MSEKTTDNTIEKAPSQIDTSDTTLSIKEVEQVKDAVDTAMSETTLPDRVTDLRTMLENLTEEVDGWKTWHKTDYLGAIETIKSEVDEIQNEWDAVSSNVTLLQNRLENLLQSAPGVIETATLRALTMRLNHLEQLVSQLLSESQVKVTTSGARKQFIISLVALGITIILWGVFIVMNVLN